jgi:hypothetical protein
MKIKILLSLLLLSVLFTTCKKPQQVAVAPKSPSDPTLVSVDNGRMTFHIRSPFTEITNEELGQSIKNLNSHILFLALPDSDKNTMISASVYSDSIKKSMDKAFEVTINYVGDEYYHVLDYGIYKVDNKTLRFKVSTTGMGTFNLMYYFMKDDYDYDLYELKAVTMPENYDKTKAYLESIATTVEIK